MARKKKIDLKLKKLNRYFMITKVFLALTPFCLLYTSTLPSAIYVLFGQNIGTCITAVLASIGTGRNAKRTTILHLSFNIIGTIIFVIISMLTPFAQWMQALTPTNIPAQIANVHTVFNVATTILLLPFGKQLVQLAYKILPEKEGHEDRMDVKFLDFSIFTNDYHIGTRCV